MTIQDGRGVPPPPQPTIRDQFAMAALTGALANPMTAEEARKAESCGDASGSEFHRTVCGVCYQIADAMLAARATPSPTGGMEEKG